MKNILKLNKTTKFRSIYYLLIVFTLTFNLTTILSATDDINLGIFPSSIELAKGEKANITVQLQNNSTNKIYDVKLSFHNTHDITVPVETQQIQFVNPEDVVFWDLVVEKGKDVPNDSRINFKIDYNINNKSITHHTKLCTFDIKKRKIETIADLVTISIEGDSEQLYDNRNKSIKLLVRNITDIPITLKKIDIKLPDYIISKYITSNYKEPVIKTTNDNTTNSLTLNTIITPNKTFVQEINLITSKSIKPGQHSILFLTELEWEQRGETYSGIQLTKYDLKLTVFGESEIISLLGIPSLLVLPGFLFITSYKILKKWFFHNMKFLEITGKDEEYWLIAISFSIVVVVLYPIITKLFGNPQNYLERYGFKDIYNIWVFSILSGFLFCVITYLFFYIDSKRKEITLNDTPCNVLKKLMRNKKKSTFPFIVLTSNKYYEKGKLYFKLIKLDNGEIWVSSQMTYCWINSQNDWEKEKKSLNQKIDEGFSDIKTLYNFFKENVKKGNINEPTWDISDSLKIITADDYKNDYIVLGESRLLYYKETLK